MVTNPAFTVYFHRVPYIFQFTLAQLWALYPSVRVDVWLRLTLIQTCFIFFWKFCLKNSYKLA